MWACVCWHIRHMQKLTLILVIASLAPFAALAQEGNRVYKWVDEDGVVHYGDSIPPQYAELPKEVVNDHGVTVDNLAGKKSEEEIEAERLEEERQAAIELERRADQALLATYLSVDEILMHRDRRVELFQAQARVTELYLRNLERRMHKLRTEAANFQPYSEDPDAPMISEDLAGDIQETKAIIARHESNLAKYKHNEQQIIASFDNDISRFKVLKGIQ